MLHALRLGPNEELKSSLIEFCRSKQLESAYIATCVGSLSALKVRLANADRSRPNEILTVEDKRFEIVSFVGTVSPDGVHLHGSFADCKGHVVGGHFIEGTVFTTAEIVVGNVPNVKFRRVFDDATGFDELTVVDDA